MPESLMVNALRLNLNTLESKAKMRGIIFGIFPRAAIILGFSMSKRKGHPISGLQLWTCKLQNLCVKTGARNKKSIYNVKVRPWQKLPASFFDVIRLAQPAPTCLEPTRRACQSASAGKPALNRP
jgi:hypothetical protein